LGILINACIYLVNNMYMTSFEIFEFLFLQIYELLFHQSWKIAKWKF